MMQTRSLLLLSPRAFLPAVWLSCRGTLRTSQTRDINRPGFLECALPVFCHDKIRGSRAQILCHHTADYSNFHAGKFSWYTITTSILHAHLPPVIFPESSLKAWKPVPAAAFENTMNEEMRLYSQMGSSTNRSIQKPAGLCYRSRARSSIRNEKVWFMQ